MVKDLSQKINTIVTFEPEKTSPTPPFDWSMPTLCVEIHRNQPEPESKSKGMQAIFDPLTRDSGIVLNEKSEQEGLNSASEPSPRYCLNVPAYLGKRKETPVHMKVQENRTQTSSSSESSPKPILPGVHYDFSSEY